MALERRPLLRLSACDCGFTTLKDEIPLGTVYTIDTGTVRRGTYRCGGCQKTTTMDMVRASQILRPELPMMPLPVILFEKEEVN